jgi:hypothetical protein
MMRLPILAAIAASTACLLIIGYVAGPDTGQAFVSIIRPSPDSSPGSVPNPYCRSGPTGDLPPLDVSDMRLWNYDASWHASQWDNSFSYIPWRSDHVVRANNEDVILQLDRSGAPQIKSGRAIAMADRGTWEVEATLPEMREGLVVAPLWLFNEDRREEIDFEFVGTKGLDLSLHAYPGGEYRKTVVPLFRGMDFSNCTVRFKIVADIPAGWAEMYLEGVLLHRFEKEELGHFVTGETRPIIEMWAARDDNRGFVQWLGRWQGLSAREALTMRVHGYRYSSELLDR